MNARAAGWLDYPALKPEQEARFNRIERKADEAQALYLKLVELCGSDTYILGRAIEAAEAARDDIYIDHFRDQD